MVKADTISLRKLFSRIAPYYDRGNTVISLGRDKAWRRAVARELGPAQDGMVLDLATGTGELALETAARGWRVVGADFCAEMMRRGRLKEGEWHGPQFLLAEATTLPFRDGSFAAVTMGFALRHFPDLPPLLREVWRVLRPEGKLLSLELTPPQGSWAPLQRFYLAKAVPLLGYCATGDWDSYRYLPASLHEFPAAASVARLLEEAGFHEIRCSFLGLGVAALHSARR